MSSRRREALAHDAQLAGYAAYLSTVRRTSRITLEGRPAESVLATVWHDTIFSLLVAAIGQPQVAIYIREQPRLADMLDLLKRLGVHAIVSNHGTPAGVRAARDWLATPGRVLAITLDGGAAREPMPGVARLARIFRVPLCPLRVTVTSGFRRDGWDRCVVPRLGARIELALLPAVSLGAGLDAAAAALGRALPEPTLGTVAGLGSRWSAAFDGWPRACLMPLPGDPTYETARARPARLRIGSRTFTVAGRADAPGSVSRRETP
jgi:lysophospholipid acyltransferase (LPLAT)-like uncharacterized protein